LAEAMIGCVTIIIGDLASLLGCSMQVGTGKRWEHLSSPLVVNKGIIPSICMYLPDIPCEDVTKHIQKGA